MQRFTDIGLSDHNGILTAHPYTDTTEAMPKSTPRSKMEKAARVWLETLLISAVKTPALRRKLPKNPAELSIDIEWVSQKESRELKRDYFGMDQATDVLAFPAPDPFWTDGILGQLYICPVVLKRQAKEARHSETMELKILLTHGFLHLLGFDHEEGRAQFNAMLKWEKTFMGKKAGLLQRNQSETKK